MHTAVLTTTLLAMLAAGNARAHDTWFEHLPGNPAQLALGTGSQFPRFETGIDERYLARQGCLGADGQLQALQPRGQDEAALRLAAPAGATSCWVQLQPLTIELAPDRIEPYLRELNADPDLRAAWAAMQARGLPWKERYTKHARIELAPGSGHTPAPLGLDAVFDDSGPSPALRVLRDGLPLPGLALELRHERSAVGLRQRSDAQGRVRLPPLPPGRWVLRGIDLRLSATEPGTWDSRFLTLAFEVQKASSFSSNTRSTSHTMASTAIASEPPSSTTRR
jgi:hypothetical protein